jgi:putative RecB family exonuclease
VSAEQLGLEGMPRRLYACTPSRLNTWLDCPRRYRMTYLDRPQPSKGPPWAHNSLGVSVHNALAAWWRLPVDRRTVEMAGTLLLRGWLTEGFRDAEQSAAWRTRARDLVERYVSGLDPRDEPVGVERTVATRTDVIALSGRIDRLDARPGESGQGTELVVVDYKTGRRVLTEDDARTSLALALYAIAASRMLRRPCRRVELHHLRTGRVAVWQHTDESLARQLRRAEQIAAEAQDADAAYRTMSDAARPGTGAGRTSFDEIFPPRPGALCAWCDFSRHCPEGRQAAAPKEPWAALAETPA